MADAREAEQKELEALTAALNRSAERVQTLWLSFLVFTLYLAVAVVTTTHRMLFREDPLKLPVLNIDLPLLGFYTLAPALFVLFHFYMLLNLVLLARTAKAFETGLGKAFPRDIAADEAERENFRMRVENTLFAQLLVGGKRERDGFHARLLALISFITLAITPVALLLFVEIRFLPYHSALITWWHRGLLLLVIVFGVTLWPSYRRGWGERLAPSGWRKIVVYLATGLPVVGYALFVANFPDEWLYNSTASVRRKLGIFEASFKDMKPEEAAKANGAIWSHALWIAWAWPASALDLRYEDLIDEARRAGANGAAKAGAEARWTGSITLHNRNLIAADLTNVDVEHAEFSGSDLSRAKLEDIWAPKAHFGASDQGPTNLRGAMLDGGQLQATTFGQAQMQGASLKKAQLQGASLEETQLQGASLDEVQMQGASLKKTQMQGASLDEAQMQGAALVGAQLQGATLDGAQLQGATLDGAQLQGATFAQAQLQAATFNGTQLQGATLDGADLRGATFYRTAVWRADARSSENPEGARIAEPDFAGAFGCELGDFSGGVRTCVLPQSEFDKVMATPETIPDGALKAAAVERLARLKWIIDAPTLAGADDMVRQWRSLSDPPLPPAKLLAAWREIGCRPNDDNRVLDFFSGSYLGAPYVARALIKRLDDSINSEAAAQAELAKAFLAPDCVGAQGLTDKEKARLKTLLAPAP